MILSSIASSRPERLLVEESTATVFVVDEDVSVRKALGHLLQRPGWRVVTCATAREFLSHQRVGGPACLILDVQLPDLSGLDLQKRIVERDRDMPIVFIAGRSDIPTTVQAMKAGALEFFTKPFAEDRLLGAVQHAIERSRAARRRDAILRALRARYESLTSRERQVMGLAVYGLLNKQIGGELGISEITVKAHRGQVMRKTRVESFAELVRMASTLELPLAATLQQAHEPGIELSRGAA